MVKLQPKKNEIEIFYKQINLMGYIQTLHLCQSTVNRPINREQLPGFKLEKKKRFNKNFAQEKLIRIAFIPQLKVYYWQLAEGAGSTQMH